MHEISTAPDDPLHWETLLRAYAIGVFPMADHRDEEEVYWVDPRRRAILPLDGFALSRRLARTIRSDRFTVTADHAFADVLRHCATTPRDGGGTWINHRIEGAYGALHARGAAHSIECWEGEQLVGGLYGVSLGRAFFGESMFSLRRDASKVALAHLVARLWAGGYDLLDCQFMTDHLRSLGAVEIDRADYRARLYSSVSGAGSSAAGAGAGSGAGAAGAGAAAAGGEAGRWRALDGLLGAPVAPSSSASRSGNSLSSSSPGQRIVQLLTNTS